MKVVTTPKRGSSTLVRLLGWLFGCGELTNAHRGAASFMCAARCRKRMAHRGDHEFILPDGWELGA